MNNETKTRNIYKNTDIKIKSNKDFSGFITEMKITKGLDTIEVQYYDIEKLDILIKDILPKIRYNKLVCESKTVKTTFKFDKNIKNKINKLLTQLKNFNTCTFTELFINDNILKAKKNIDNTIDTDIYLLDYSPAELVQTLLTINRVMNNK